ncbi:MAG: hypothetical protein LUM44_22600 [Pyrinomonadaceae bacterium]|nr:hypothetical protein [Pyrinomonadaceae bacterium]
MIPKEFSYEIKKLKLNDYLFGDETERRKFAADLLAVLKEYGFFILTDHGLDTELIARSVETSRRFFELPTEIKENYNIPEANGQRGYTGFGIKQAIKNNAPDPKEYWHMGRDSFSYLQSIPAQMQNVYPREVPEFRPVISDLFDQSDKIGKTLLAALGEAIKAPENHFEELVEEGNCVVRCLHYPATASLVDMETSTYRAAPHKDINFFTMLIGETNSGLQFECPDGSWLDVKAAPGEIIVDSGEMLSLITNNKIQATMHQVVKPKDAQANRISIVFLVHPRPEAELVCIDSCRNGEEQSEPITAHNYLMERIDYWQKNQQ